MTAWVLDRAATEHVSSAAWTRLKNSQNSNDSDWAWRQGMITDEQMREELQTAKPDTIVLLH